MSPVVMMPPGRRRVGRSSCKDGVRPDRTAKALGAGGRATGAEFLSTLLLPCLQASGRPGGVHPTETGRFSVQYHP